MADLDELIKKRNQLNARIKDETRKMAERERKARNHALMVAGGLVIKHAPDGDWKNIDWDALAAWLNKYGYKITECKAESLETDDAYKRLRNWEQANRVQSKGKTK